MSRLELNARNRLRVREYEFAFPVSRPITILYASDLHLHRWNQHVAEQLIAVAHRTRPDQMLLGGDLADTRGGLKHLAGLIAEVGPVASIPGNHEHWLGVDRLRNCVLNAGGHWLPDRGIEIAGMRIGSQEGDLICAHDPSAILIAAERGTRLVLAGHLHGGQAVFSEKRGRLYPGSWFFRWNGDRFLVNETTLLVSRGMNDTLPIRWNCPRDVLLCRIYPMVPAHSMNYSTSAFEAAS